MKGDKMDEKEILDKLRAVFIEEAKGYLKHNGDPEIGDTICVFGSAIAGLDYELYNLEKLIALLSK